jgi:membrane protease YdiL (CAAX protease family)
MHVPMTHAHQRDTNKAYAMCMVLYAILALTIDSLSTQHAYWLIDWSRFYWRFKSGFEMSTAILWLGIPVLLMCRDIDIRVFTFARWKKIDVWLLIALMLLGACGVYLIKFIPVLNQYYQPQEHLGTAMKWSFATGYLIWLASWLIGWEFLHRVFLLRYLQAALGAFGPCCIPAFEFLFHLQKSLPEALGMLLLSIVLTYWSYKRKNVLLPFLAHLSIELTLLAYLII